MHINRLLNNTLADYLKQFPAVAVMGPRQSGKTTLLRSQLGQAYRYLSMDQPEIRALFYDDPQKFMRVYNEKVIFDEAQLVPELFPLLKWAIDSQRTVMGNFVLSGSGQFLLGRTISESLAGRIGLLPLMPLQWAEVPETQRPLMPVRGGYPELHIRPQSDARAWFSSYVETYLQKDLRQLLQITDLRAFLSFLRLLATQASQTLNISDLSRTLGTSASTLTRWLSVLEASYIVFLLPPYYNNLGKRITKSPKLYFMDNGLLAYLTAQHHIGLWEEGPLYGPLFENLIVSEMLKRNFHERLYAECYYYRSSHGEEIDLIIDHNGQTTLVEMKASETYRPLFHKSLDKLALPNTRKIVVYQGPSKAVTDTVQALHHHDFLTMKWGD